MYFIIICVALSVRPAVLPSDLPGASLLKLLGTIDQPVAAAFYSFSGSRDTPDFPPIDIRNLVFESAQ